MTVYIEKPAVNLREELDAIRGQIAALQSERLVRLDYANFVRNGGFDSDTLWTKGASVTINGGVAVIAQSVPADALTQSLAGKIVPTRSYRTEFTILNYVSGNILVRLANTGLAPYNGTFRTANGTYAEVFPVEAASPQIEFASSTAFNGQIDNVSVWECDPAGGDPWLRLPNGYRVGSYGLIVRDGVVLHPSDYTEIFDGETAFIKPLVAPGVSTEFSVFATKR